MSTYKKLILLCLFFYSGSSQIVHAAATPVCDPNPLTEKRIKSIIETKFSKANALKKNSSLPDYFRKPIEESLNFSVKALVEFANLRTKACAAIASQELITPKPLPYPETCDRQDVKQIETNRSGIATQEAALSKVSELERQVPAVFKTYVKAAFDKYGESVTGNDRDLTIKWNDALDQMKKSWKADDIDQIYSPEGALWFELKGSEIRSKINSLELHKSQMELKLEAAGCPIIQAGA